MQIIKADEVFNLEPRGLKYHDYFLIIQSGHNYGSDIYVKNKVKAVQEYTDVIPQVVNVEPGNKHFLKSLVATAANDVDCIGIMPQLPLEGFDEAFTESIINDIPSDKDVDGLKGSESSYIPATVRGVLKFIQHINGGERDLKGQNVLILGRSREVGRPLAHILSDKNYKYNATVTLAHSQSNVEELCANPMYKYIISAIGKPLFIKKVPDCCNCIDVGISKIEDATKKSGFRTVGDFDPDCIQNAATWTSVPGGCGPMTIKCLMENINDAFFIKH